jgi:hypothetical protein
MAIAQRTVNYAVGIDAAALLVIDIVKAVKAGKSATEIAGSELGELIGVLGAVSGIPTEEKDRATCLETIGYRLGDLADAFLG